MTSCEMGFLRPHGDWDSLNQRSLAPGVCWSAGFSSPTTRPLRVAAPHFGEQLLMESQWDRFCFGVGRISTWHPAQFLRSVSRHDRALGSAIMTV
jgi:hypothetical protein